MKNKTDVIIVGTGAAGLFCALELPRSLQILMITKDEAENSDSFLAQGGICMLKNDGDFESYYEDTMKAGHYQNDPEAVSLMIRKSPEIIASLVDYGVDFKREASGFAFTREGAHSTPRILYHEDMTGKEITGKLLSQVKTRENITLMEYTTMVDLITEGESCLGIMARDKSGEVSGLFAHQVVLATGGLGGLFRFSTNFPHITGDALAIAINHGIALQNIHYIQIHPTTLYEPSRKGRSFLISESVRGEGGILLNKKGERFVNELLPRDVLTKAILAQEEKDGCDYVRLSVVHLGEAAIKERFPNIYSHCLEAGYNLAVEPIPVTPAQHYFMGGIQVDMDSRTSFENLYAVGETSCNGVHGANRLASNSLLESLVFARRAAADIAKRPGSLAEPIKIEKWRNPDSEVLKTRYRNLVLEEIKRKDVAFYEKWCCR